MRGLRDRSRGRRPSVARRIAARGENHVLTCRQSLAAAMALAVIASALAASAADAYLVHGANGRLYGIMPKAGTHLRGHGAAVPRVVYYGGTVMLGTSLHLIFWGPPNQFAATYEASIIQWARDLATDSGKTTNEFSVASLYYRTHPRKQITRNVSFVGAVADTRPYPANGCLNPANRSGVCLSDPQLQAEVRRAVGAQHWPKDRPNDPRNQYLLFTPKGVDSCDDSLDTSCTFSSKNQYCAYHSSMAVGGKTIVYSVLPDLPNCASGQAPSGVAGDVDADGTLDSAIHEVLESATDPGTKGGNDYGWVDSSDNEVGDECSPSSGTSYGIPLGGSLDANSAFNQVIGGHDYYTQEIWAIKTPFSAAPGCVQRVGPSPVFTAPAATAGQAVSFDGSGSYDLTGRITTYVWVYGDGSPPDSTQGAHGVHVYAQPGTYQVTLGVEDGSGFANAMAETQTVVVQ